MTQAYVVSREYTDFWREAIQVHWPHATFNLASLRKFLTAEFNLLEQAYERPGPPVQELIRAETDGEHLSFRVLKHALDTVNSTTDSELAASGSEDEVDGLVVNPYLRPLTAEEWLSVWRG